MNVSMEMMKGSTIPMITTDDTYVYTTTSNKDWDTRSIKRLSF